MTVIIRCELPHYLSSAIYAADHEVVPESPEWDDFQMTDDPTELGYEFVRWLFDDPAVTNPEDVVWENPEGI